MKCVKCDGTLRRVQLEDVEVDRCDSCSGIWFDSGELQRILGRPTIEELRTKAKANKNDDSKRARCPKCRGEGKLVQVASLTSDVHIDTCAVCGGQWLDAGELEILRGDGPLRSVGSFFRRLFGG
jgi:Zn-finger nucleic acid-binding protein